MRRRRCKVLEEGEMCLNKKKTHVGKGRSLKDYGSIIDAAGREKF
jgi:hypothetical protein